MFLSFKWDKFSMLVRSRFCLLKISGYVPQSSLVTYKYILDLIQCGNSRTFLASSSNKHPNSIYTTLSGPTKHGSGHCQVSLEFWQLTWAIPSSKEKPTGISTLRVQRKSVAFTKYLSGRRRPPRLRASQSHWFLVLPIMLLPGRS